MVDGQLVYERGYGMADVENQVPATPDTIYRLASISKMFTAVAALQLVEQGKLDLAAPIQQYVPSFPKKDQGTVTAELLLKHQSGIRHYKGDEVRSAVFYNRVGDSLVIFQEDPLLFPPGEKFSYTTYGYNLLGTAIEGASGEDYVGYVTQHILEPCGIDTMRPTTLIRSFHIARPAIDCTASAKRPSCATTSWSTSATRFPAAAGAPRPATWAALPSPS